MGLGGPAAGEYKALEPKCTRDPAWSLTCYIPSEEGARKATRAVGEVGGEFVGKGGNRAVTVHGHMLAAVNHRFS